MGFAYVNRIESGIITRWGFKGRKQRPLFMIWKEQWDCGNVCWAHVVFQSSWLLKGFWWKGLFKKEDYLGY